MVPETPRKAGPYRITATSLEFPFSFYMISGDDVVVTINDLDGNDVELDKQYYTVTLNSSQKTTPGGVVTLKQSIETLGTVLAITSGMPYTQNLDLHNSGNFNPVVINKEEDRRVIQLQQLLEELKRCILVPVTSELTREELLQNLLNIANTANEYAQKAEQILKETQEVKAEIDSIEESAKEAINTKGEEEQAELSQIASDLTYDINAAGSAQVERIQAIGDWALMGLNAACQEGTFTATEEVASGAELTLPLGMQYLPGRKHVRVSWNGIVLPRGLKWSDVGTEDSFSTSIKILMPLAVGDQVNVFIAPLGAQDYASEIARITALEERVTALESSTAELSRSAVFATVNTQEE